MRVPGWVVVLAMMINAAGLMLLKSLPQSSLAYIYVPAGLAALGVFLGLVKSPISVVTDTATETTTLTQTTTAPVPPPKQSGKASLMLIALMALAGLGLLGAFALAAPGCAYMRPADPATISPATATRIECDSLDGSVTGWTAAGYVVGALGSATGVSTLFTESTPRYATGGVSLGLSAVGALSAYLALHYARLYAQRCTTNTSGDPLTESPHMPATPQLAPQLSPSPAPK